MRSLLPRFVPALCLAVACAFPAGARACEAENAELWSGEIYTATYRAGVCVKKGGALRGVLLLRTWTGAVDVYHIVGKVSGDRIEARHHSGHSFVGRYVSPSMVKGTIRLKSGRKIDVSGKRKLGAKLSDECAPL